MVRSMKNLLSEYVDQRVHGIHVSCKLIDTDVITESIQLENHLISHVLLALNTFYLFHLPAYLHKVTRI